MTPNKVVFGNAADRPTEAILGSGYKLLVPASETGGAYELMKFVVPPGLGPPKHLHTREDEHYFFIDGAFEVTVGEETIEATQGTFLHLPRSIPHCLINIGETEGSFLCWVIPGNLGELFAQFKIDWPKDQKYPPILTRDDIQMMTTSAGEYGIEFVM